jgi:3-oxoacyl-[acyl-carrier protein] reductase
MKEAPLVLVSGGSRGLGLALVEALLREGYRTATFSRSPTDALTQLAGRYPGKLTSLAGDMADAAALEEVVRRVEREAGPIEALINNAGIAHDGVLATMRPCDVEQLISVNLTGTLLLTRLVVRHLLVRGRGVVLSISSIIGLRGYSGLAAYSATKAGLDGMTRALARELGGRNIRVNAIAPGYLETEMTGKLDEGQKQQIVRRTPLGRLGRPEDVVGTVLFLLSPAASFITGQTLVIDGGITC